MFSGRNINVTFNYAYARFFSWRGMFVFSRELAVLYSKFWKDRRVALKRVCFMFSGRNINVTFIYPYARVFLWRGMFVFSRELEVLYLKFWKDRQTGALMMFYAQLMY
jgi:hypothetical protein